MNRSIVRLMLSIIFVMALLIDMTSADTFTWTGQALTGKWDQNSFTVTNWVGNVIPVSGSATQLVFSSIANQGTPNQEIANPFLLNSLTFGGPAFTLNGSALQFEFSGSDPSIIQNSSSIQTINENIVLDAPLLLTGGGSGTINLAGIISQTNSGEFLDKEGSTSFTLSAANTFSGSTVINGGNIVLGNPLALQNSTVNLDVDNGLNLNTLASATLGGLAGNGALNLGATSLSVGNNGQSSNYSGMLSSATGAGSLIKTGAGALTLGGAGNNFNNLEITSGNVLLSGGSLALTSLSGTATTSEALAVGFGTPGSSLTVQGGATLDTSQATVTGISGTNASPAMMAVTGSHTTWRMSFLVDIGEVGPGELILDQGATASGFSDIVVGFAANSTLIVQGGASLDSYSDSIASSAESTCAALVTGIGSSWTDEFLSIGGSSFTFDAGGTGTLTISSGGKIAVANETFIYNGGKLIINGGTFTTGLLATVSGDSAPGAAIILQADPIGGHALTINGSGNTGTYPGTISGAGSLLKTGTSVQILSGINTYTGGTTINGGTLEVDGLITGAVQINSSGQLQGIGTIGGIGGSVIAATGGTLAPGSSSSTGTLSIIGSAIINSGAVISLQLSGTAPGTQFDQLHVQGQLNLSGSLQVSLVNGFTPVAGNSFDILDWGTLIGQFSTLQLPSLTAPLDWDVSHLYTTGVITAIPFLAGDVNRDGHVNVADVSALMAALADLGSYQSTFSLTNRELLEVADINGNGKIDNTDLQALITLIANNTASGGGQLTAVPEPATLILCVMGFGVLAVRRVGRILARQAGAISIATVSSTRSLGKRPPNPYLSTLLG